MTARLSHNAELGRRLLRMRCLDRFRMDGEWLVAVDATEPRTYSTRHCEHCLTRPPADGTKQYFHAVPVSSPLAVTT